MGPGGEPGEVGDLVPDVLARHPDFVRAPAREAVPADVLTSDGDFQVLPQRHGTDGAYAARLMRGT